MKEEVARNPLAPVGMNSRVNVLFLFLFKTGQARDKILREELHEKIQDESLKTSVLAALPLRVENTLTTFRNSIIGPVPHTREEYEPHRVLQSITGGTKVLCLDSENLPPDWREMDLNQLFDDRDVGGANEV